MQVMMPLASFTVASYHGGRQSVKEAPVELLAMQLVARVDSVSEDVVHEL